MGQVYFTAPENATGLYNSIGEAHIFADHSQKYLS